MVNNNDFLMTIKGFLREVHNARHYYEFNLVRAIMDFPRWKRCLNKNPLNIELPWICFSAIDFMEKRLKKNMYIFEYGSGGSTLFFAQRVSKVISVEHDKDWYKNIDLLLRERKILNVDLKLFLPEQDNLYNVKLIQNPSDYISDDPLYANKAFINYSKSIEQYPDGCFDLVVIDGRARPSCMIHAINKIKVGGYLLLDNSERAYYLQSTNEHLGNFKMVLNSFGPVPYSRTFSRTTIWIKHESN